MKIEGFIVFIYFVGDFEVIMQKRRGFCIMTNIYLRMLTTTMAYLRFGKSFVRIKPTKKIAVVPKTMVR